MVTRIYKTQSEIAPPPQKKKFGGQNIKIWAKFRTTSEVDRAYLRNKTRHRRTENGDANCYLSCAGVLNLMKFGLQTEKNRTVVLTNVMRLRCVGHVS